MSAKKLKLSLEAPESESGFQPYVLIDEGSGARSSESFHASAGEESKRSFGLPKTFWKWMEGDRELRQQFEEMIEERTKARLTTKLEEEKARIRDSAREEGIQLGLAEGRLKLEEAQKSLSTICEDILKEKASILSSHKDYWIRALSHLMRRFMLKERELVLPEIEKWLQEGIAHFEQSGKIRLHLSPTDYQKLASSVSIETKRNWELISDPSLAPGTLHCECGNGGLIFDPGKELDRLERIIEGAIARKGNPP